MNKTKKIIGILLFLHIIGLSFAQEYKIIINDDNPISSITIDKLDKIFLKKVTKWNDGSKINPVNLTAESTVREKFTQTVHDKKISAINAYWQKQIFTGKGVPPVEKKSDQNVIQYIKANPGAIGYVSASANTAGVKVIQVAN